MTEEEKESAHLLQLIDCNCNDCKFMIRDQQKFHNSTSFHYVLCLREFVINHTRVLANAQKWYNKGEWEKGLALEIEGNAMDWQFDKKGECPVNFGRCSKLKKDVSFIPNTCQLETQQCFEHRKTWAIQKHS